ncbi:MAG: glycosyltransferase, partial [Thermoanaerobaculia bacterium]
MTTDPAPTQNASSTLPFFSVVVPVLNGGAVFREVLEALRRSSFNDYELWVVDDGSMDDSSTWAEKSGARLLRTRGRQVP